MGVASLRQSRLPHGVGGENDVTSLGGRGFLKGGAWLASVGVASRGEEAWLASVGVASLRGRGFASAVAPSARRWGKTTLLPSVGVASSKEGRGSPRWAWLLSRRRGGRGPAGRWEGAWPPRSPAPQLVPVPRGSTLSARRQRRRSSLRRGRRRRRRRREEEEEEEEEEAESRGGGGGAGRGPWRGRRRHRRARRLLVIKSGF